MPRQLPAVVRDFTGRAADLTALDGLLPHDGGSGGEGTGSGQPSAVVIGGMAGVGKTSLAVYWAYRVRHHFPDGTLYANLRGYGPGDPAAPGEVLEGFLRALGTPPARVPLTVDGQAALYRTVLDGRRVLVVLDNALTPDQVRPLLPSSGTCLTLITSRSSLTGLAISDGAMPVSLGLLPAEEAVALLRGIIGAARADAEQAAVAELARACAYLPLALRIAGQRTVFRPHLSLEDAAAELSDQRDTLNVLNVPGDTMTAVRSVFSWSYLSLPADQARMFRLLGLHPGVEISVHAAAALDDTSPAQARGMLDVLSEVHLVDPAGRDRYLAHDLLLVYARELVEDTESAGDRAAAVERLCRFYLHAADGADRAMMLRRRITLDASAGPRHPLTFDNGAAASAWFEAEHATLTAVASLAAEAGLYTVAWQIPATMQLWYNNAGRRDEWVTAMRDGVAAAQMAGSQRGEGYLLGSLSDVLLELRRPAEAVEHAQRAVSIARETADRDAEAMTTHVLGAAYSGAKRFDLAATWLQQALAICLELADEWLAAVTRANLGDAYLGLKRFDEARDCLRQAIQYFRETHEQGRQCYATLILADVYRATGQPDIALECYRQSRDLAREVGIANFEARALDGCGTVLRASGDVTGAKQHWWQALALFERIGDPQADDVRARLAALGSLSDPALGLGRPDAASRLTEDRLPEAISLLAGRGGGGLVAVRPRVRRGRNGRLAIARAVLWRPALVLSRSNHVLTLRRILLGTTCSSFTWRRARPVKGNCPCRPN